MPGDHLSGVWGLLTRQDPQQSRFASTIKPEDDHLGSTVDIEVYPGKHLQRAVSFGEVACCERGFTAWGRIGEADGGYLIDGPFSLNSRE